MSQRGRHCCLSAGAKRTTGTNLMVRQKGVGESEVERRRVKKKVKAFFSDCITRRLNWLRKAIKQNCQCLILTLSCSFLSDARQSAHARRN